MKIAGIILGSLVILLVAFHFWVVAHAEEIVQDLVSSKSHGKLKLKVEKFRFNWFSRKMELKNAVFYSTDSVGAGSAYQFSVKDIKIHVKDVWSIIFDKKIVIDLLSLQSPDIQVNRLRSVKDTSSEKEVSVPGEMGRIYNSIQDALQVLKVKRFEIDNASFTLVNKLQPEQLPIRITHIDFHIDNFNVDADSLRGKENFFFSDNIVLSTKHQDILFPDGKHRLSFSRFRINMLKKLVQFDSCTIAAVKKDSSDAAFNVFFDALLLTHIDFDTLYRHEVIKADSVYCLNPRFILDVKWGKRTDKKKQPPKLDKIIQQLTGDMQLGAVIVNNASFAINIERRGQPSSFTSDHNNFEIHGFDVNKNAAQPLHIQSFAMAIRNYENFLRDSSYSMQFDSILFNNDRIFLSNFRLQELSRGKIANDFQVPQFGLRGLSWDELVFNRRLKAQEATLYYPLISYSVRDNIRTNHNIFDALGRLGHFMEMERLNIISGRIDLLLKGNTQLHLQDATLSVESRALLAAKGIEGLESSVTSLHFNEGIIKTNDINVKLQDAYYTGNENILRASRIDFSSPQKNITGQASEILFNKITVDQNNGAISVDDIHWKKADINLHLQSKAEGVSTFTLKNIKGANTTIIAVKGENKLTTYLQTISLSSLIKAPGKKWEVTNFMAAGNKLKLVGNHSLLTINNYFVEDKKLSTLTDINYSQQKKDTIDVTIPRLSAVPNIPALLKGIYDIDNVNLANPVALVHLAQSVNQSNDKAISFPTFSIHKINISQPDLTLTKAGKEGPLRIMWDGTKDSNFLQIEDFSTGGALNKSGFFKNIKLGLNHFQYSNAGRKPFTTGEGNITATLSDLSFTQDEDKTWDWSGNIARLAAKKFRKDSIGQKNGILSLNEIGIKNMAIGKSFLLDAPQIIEHNSALAIFNFTGAYTDDNNHYDWLNVNYDATAKQMSLDSFVYNPVLSRDSFITRASYQTSYLTARSGKIVIDGIDAPTYAAKKILNIHSVTADNASINDFRDLQKPFLGGIIKPLPVHLIKKIPLKFSIDSITLNNANAIHEEVNAKSGDTASIPVTRMSVHFFPVRNYDLGPTDSLRIQANGYVLDTLWVRLRVRESYQDSLAGFLMTVRMRATDLTLLNPIMVPLTSVKLQSGLLDTLTLRAAGMEHLAFGEMKMFYHDLKVKFLKNGNETKKHFLSGLITFVLNNFIIRNKNTSRTGFVFFLRLRERSALNYLVKITMSGVASSTGAKSNRKLVRKYKKELRLRNLPPVDYD